MIATPSTLLLVDDDEMNRDMFARRLQRAGYHVVVAANGQEALAVVEQQRVSLVLLDVMMPGISGIEVLRRIRAMHSPGRLPVIMVTAKTQAEDVVGALDLGANDYVTKPIDLAVALARIRAQIVRSQAEQALHDSKEHYALAMEGANEGLWDWNVATGDAHYSPRWKAIMGYGADDELAGRAAWFDRIHPDDVERVRSELERHLEVRSEHFEIEHRVLAEDGTCRWALARGRAFRDRAGKAIRVAGSLSDVTAGRAIEPLTGLSSREMLTERSGRLLEYSRRVPEFQFAVLQLDLDRFKTINEGLGRQAGDQLIIAVARRLEQVVARADEALRPGGGDDHRSWISEPLIARLGGDEFVVLRTGIHHPGDAARVAEHVLEAFSEPFTVAGRDVFINASIGIALSASGYDRAEDMLRDADTALYRAKARGRGRFDLFDADMRTQVVQRLQLETDMRRALDQREFMLHYQPMVSLAGGGVTGVEALIRWNHPARGLLLPDAFLPVAEDTGLILPIDLWVIREACRQIREWGEAGGEIAALLVAVNVSARLFARPDFPERLVEIAGEHGIPPRRLELELTESGVMTDPDTARATIERLKAIGFRVCIDDFGTGYSSLNYLHLFPVDRLKIDRSFLTHVATQAEAQGIVEAIVRVAEHLKLEVVAEGIETISQLRQVELLKCGFGQGFYFARPMAPRPGSRLLLRDQQSLVHI